MLKAAMAMLLAAATPAAAAPVELLSHRAAYRLSLAEGEGEGADRALHARCTSHRACHAASWGFAAAACQDLRTPRRSACLLALAMRPRARLKFISLR